ncbi:MAG: hypothetical protein WDZ94_05705 [Patescibacteria group bacterium]
MAKPKVTLVSSVRNRGAVLESITAIVDILEKNNIPIFHDHVTQTSQSQLESQSDEKNLDFFNQVIRLIRGSDIVISECSVESFSVGHLLTRAMELNKEVIIFYRSTSKKPNMYPFLRSKKNIYLVDYQTIDELKELVLDYVNYAQHSMFVRYNIMLSQEITSYLKWIARSQGTSRSVFIRDLIRAHMQANPDYRAAASSETQAVVVN